MRIRRLFLCLSIVFFASTAGADSATANFGDAQGKSGEIWETYYKFTALIEDGKLTRLIYQNAEQFDLHYQYLATLPQFKGMSRQQIDALTYKASPGRLAYTGVLTVHAGDDAIHRSRFSLVMEDSPNADLVAQIFALIKNSSTSEDAFGTALDFELLPHQENSFAGEIAKLRAKGISLYFDPRREVPSISYTQAWNTGRLVEVINQDSLDAKVQTGEVNETTIIFAKEALREIPLVAGVISAVRLTPASHTVLLAQMYGIPVAYFKDAVKHFSPLKGRTILLRANGNPNKGMDRRAAEFSADPTPADLALLAELKSQSQITPPFQPEEMAIRPTQELTQENIGSYGGKASQMGTLMRRFPQNSVEKSLAIPLGFSVHFLRTAGASTGQTLSEFIAEQLATLGPDDLRDLKKVEAVTAKIQYEIKGANFPIAHLKKIEDTIRAYFPGNPSRVRFRSSSNVEDGNEFNGAGLYDSTGVWLVGRKRDDVGEKIKKVIASLYNARAYVARRKFGVDENKVGMGLLVHPAFTGEVGNGVVRIIVDKQREHFHFEAVTLKGDDEQVTHASGEGAAEVLTGFGDYRTRETFPRFTIEQPYEGYSRERSLFPSAIYEKLSGMMTEVAAEYDVPGQEIDIESEFKIMEDGAGGYQAFIKQVRRVPRSPLRKTIDGSRFVVLANNALLGRRPENLSYAHNDLWLPHNIRLEMPSFTETQIRDDKVRVQSVSFDLEGNNHTVIEPKTKSRLTNEDGTYAISISIPTGKYPSLTLEITNGEIAQGALALASGGTFFETRIQKQDLSILENANLRETMYGVYQADPPIVKPDRKGVLEIELKKGRKSVKVRGENTLFFGEGDGRSVEIGSAKISGLWKRDLDIPKSSIGYGANHHQGAESYIFDLFGDPSLNEADQRALEKAAGRYLYLLTDDQDEYGCRSLLIKPSGATKKIGAWKAKESN